MSFVIPVLAGLAFLLGYIIYWFEFLLLCQFNNFFSFSFSTFLKVQCNKGLLEMFYLLNRGSSGHGRFVKEITEHLVNKHKTNSGHVT